MRRLLFFLVYVLMLQGALERIAAQDKPASPRFAPGEVVVKFSLKSKASELSARASALGNPADAELSSYIGSLSAEVGIPLAVKQFGSGGTLIVAARQSDLLSSLRNRLRENPDVKEARVASDQATPAVDVDFKEGSPEAEALARALKENGDPNRELQALTAKLEVECHLAVAARIVSPRTLRLWPDMQKLTLDIAARLSKRPDVEYAQPNFIRNMQGQSPQ